MRSLIWPLERSTAGVGYIAALLIIPLVVATFYEVFARYVLGSPTFWAFELGYMLMGAHFLLGGALTLQRGEHVRIDFIYARLSERTKAAIDGIVYLVLLLPCTALVTAELWRIALLALTTGERSGQSAWNPAIWPFRMVLALSFTMLVLQVVAEMVKCIEVLRGRRSDRAGSGLPV